MCDRVQGYPGTYADARAQFYGGADGNGNAYFGGDRDGDAYADGDG
jgi:hypothetical protein